MRRRRSASSQVLGDAKEPAARIVGDAPQTPRLQGLQQCRLHRVFHEIQVRSAQYTRQDGHDTPIFVPEEVINEFLRWARKSRSFF